MASYILNPDAALRGWQFVPHAYYLRGAYAPQGFTRDEFTVLNNCDGELDIEPSSALDSLLARGLCRPAEDGVRLTRWQSYRFCVNRYFSAVNWAVTGKCNFNCRHCFNATGQAPLMSEFTLEQCQSFIRQLDECGVQNVTLTGGEPMIHPHFIDM
jgi:sulfatase maturation enzyme AslB (radical SAM superfamily)